MLRPPSHSSFPRTSFCFNDNVIEWSVNHVDVNRTPISTHQSFESFDSDLNDEWDAGGPLPQQLGATKYKFYWPDQKFCSKTSGASRGGRSGPPLWWRRQAVHQPLVIVKSCCTTIRQCATWDTCERQCSIPLRFYWKGRTGMCNLYIFHLACSFLLTGKGNSQRYIPSYNDNWFPTMVAQQRIDGPHF